MENRTMLTDLYQLTMMQGYLVNGYQDKEAVFDVYFRSLPFKGGYALAAGLEQVVEYIENLSFGEEDLAYLRSLNLFSEEFIEELSRFHFTGDIDAIPEGTPVFPYEPLIRVKGRIFETQLLETTILNLVNFETLIATKASRVVTAADGGPVMEFGLRRAQGPDAGILGARAAFIGGCQSTSNVLAGKRYGIPVSGTQAHSWIQCFPTELEAFRAYAHTFPDRCLLLVDTYNVLKSGVPNAIKVGLELEARGHHFVGIRLDSGDLTYLSKEARRMLDEAGLKDAIIVASNDLDEETIFAIRAQGAAINSWGVGTNLITSKDNPSLGGVYKLAAEGEQGVFHPRLKVSENIAKITNPGIKKVVRFYDRAGKAMADLIAMEDDVFDPEKPLTIFDPIQTWKRKTLTNFHTRELLIPVFRGGKRVYELPKLKEIQTYAKQELDTFWDEVKRLINPHTYIVDLSTNLFELKQQLLLTIHNDIKQKQGVE
ncbi:nicotinate phosphoribosyltransferase [Desulfosporosinus sp.]|uniref:nicotinate phosphoribosyltransferase n=1 Tax=Desulfosporosinus sp. TaxID=157907 RepID=UPI000E880A63|nr:nicotinate phosphoribosyltransferase [Desulfosporosinus sp.]MBC2721232.1 nicotinate phosphoribosyltransferase [Desulfosporosinus sp.]MBC2728664.1 nicotinate phosphoribosyltransferase [Desulfosporosinus sp.]HBV88492.1 nicotinate phosphoribosyltransferase [Desulfosporosinus sp.]